MAMTMCLTTASALAQSPEDKPIRGVRYAAPFQEWTLSFGGWSLGAERGLIHDWVRSEEVAANESPGKFAAASQLGAGLGLRQYLGKTWYIDVGYDISHINTDDDAPGASLSRLHTHLAIPLTSWDDWTGGAIQLSSNAVGASTYRVTYLDGLVPERNVVSIILGQSTYFLHVGSDALAASGDYRTQALSIDVGVRFLSIQSGAIEKPTIPLLAFMDFDRKKSDASPKKSSTPEIKGYSNRWSATLLTRTDPSEGTLATVGFSPPGWGITFNGVFLMLEAGGFFSWADAPSHAYVGLTFEFPALGSYL